MLELKHKIRKKKIMLNLNGKTAIVTGCGSEGEGWGNGRAIATLLARQGAKVIGTDLNFKAAKNTQDFILKENNKCEIALILASI